MPVSFVVHGSYGTQLKHGVAAVYTEVAGVVNFDGPSREVKTRETTNMDSLACTFAAAIADHGEVSGQIQYDPKCDSHAILETSIATPPVAPEQWQILFTDTSTATFVGILTKFAPTGIKREDNLLADFAIKVSGLVVMA